MQLPLVRPGEPEHGGGRAAQDDGVGKRQGALVQPLSGEKPNQTSRFREPI